MSTEKNVQTVKDFFAAIGRSDRGGSAGAGEDIEWIIPGEEWPLAGTHRGGIEDGHVRAGIALAIYGHRFGVDSG